MKTVPAIIAVLLGLGAMVLAGPAPARPAAAIRTVTVTRTTTTTTTVTRRVVRTSWRRVAYGRGRRHLWLLRRAGAGCGLPPQMVRDFGTRSPFCKSFRDRHYWIAPLWTY